MNRLVLSILTLIITSTCYADGDSTKSKTGNSVGITLGSPAVINFHYSWNLDDHIKLYLFGGGWFSGFYGFKPSLQYNIYRRENFESDLTFNFVISRTSVNSRSVISYEAEKLGTSYFLGPGYSLRWDWFLFRFDILTGSVNSGSFNLHFNLGYTYDF